MRWLPAVAECSLIVCAVLAAFGLAARRASRDWSYQLHVVRVLGCLLGSIRRGGLNLFEVVLVEPNLSPGSFTIASRPSTTKDVGLLELDVPLGELRAVRHVRDAATPLLFSGDVAGEAVLARPGRVPRRTC